MKRTSVALLVLAAVGVFSLAAGAVPKRVTRLEANLTLRPGVSRVDHPAVAPHGLYGMLDGAYDVRTGTLRYTLRYKALRGSPFRVVVRSRATGATFAVLCSPCSPVPAGRSGDRKPVSSLSGRVQVDPDAGFLITHDRSFVEVDTTAYPSGEIAGPIYEKVPQLPFTGPGPKPVTETPRCC
jgi:hypothetical protein